MASIRVLDEGSSHQRYQVNYEVKILNGRRTRKSHTFPVGTPKKEVLAYKRKVEEEYANAAGIEGANYNMTVNKFYPLFMEHCERQLSPSTVKSYTQACQSSTIGILKELGEVKLRELNTVRIQTYITSISKMKNVKGKDFTPKTIINQLYVISAMIEYAQKIGIVERKPNPCQFVEAPRRIQKEVEVYTREESRAILKTLADEGDLMLYFAVTMALVCGLRRSEIAGLKVQDFDLNNNILKVSRARVFAIEGDIDKETKTKSGRRTIVVAPNVTALVRKVILYKKECKLEYGTAYQHSDYLYVEPDGSPLAVSTISGHWQRWLEKHKEFKHVSFHGLRHSFCSMLLSYGIDPRALADLMGHSNAMISLNIYAHSYLETKQSYVNMLNDALYSASNE